MASLNRSTAILSFTIKHQVGEIRTLFPRSTGGCPCQLGRIPVTTIRHRPLKTLQLSMYIHMQILPLLRIQERVQSYISPSGDKYLRTLNRVTYLLQTRFLRVKHQFVQHNTFYDSRATQ